MTESNKKNLKSLLVTLCALVALNLIGIKFFKRFDLTQDKRYTLSQTSFDILGQVREPSLVDVYLDGDFPGEFKKLQSETQQLLEEFKAQNPNVRFRFVNPLDDSESSTAEKRDIIFSIFKMDNPGIPASVKKEVRANIDSIADLDEAVMKSFVRSNMLPANVTVNDRGKQTQAVVFPWATATYAGRTAKIPLLRTNSGANMAEKVNFSVQHLEYAFANAFNTITKTKKKRVIILKGNEELQDRYIFDFIQQTRENYAIIPLPLDSVASIPEKIAPSTLVVIAKPTKMFTDEQKQVLDQYIMHGGKSLWLIDQVNVEMDSLMGNPTGTTLAFPRDLSLNDMFFKYGVRINPNLVKDVLNAPVILATGQEGNTQYQPYPWYYSPLVYSESKHPVAVNLDGVRFEYANSIDTLKNGIKKTVLLHSSKYSKTVGAPVEVSLSMTQEKPEEADYAGGGNIPLAVLLEGKFHSVFENRVLPDKSRKFMPIGIPTKMIIVSDGDIIRNDVDASGQPKGQLGFDTRLQKLYGNKEFLSNCVNCLLDDNGLINIRNKQVSLPILDQEKVHQNYTAIQAITVGAPIAALLIFGALFTFLRKRRYAK